MVSGSEGWRQSSVGIPCYLSPEVCRWETKNPHRLSLWRLPLNMCNNSCKTQRTHTLCPSFPPHLALSVAVWPTLGPCTPWTSSSHCAVAELNQPIQLIYTFIQSHIHLNNIEISSDSCFPGCLFGSPSPAREPRTCSPLRSCLWLMFSGSIKQDGQNPVPKVT